MNAESDRKQTTTISVVEPVSRAVDWATQVLFRPFNFEKWLVLGFCAWLALLGENGGGTSNWSEGDEVPSVDNGVREASEWVLAHLMLILTVVGVLFVLCFALWLILLWVSSRGKFMFLDGVVHDRAAVVEPWRRFRELANSLVVFRLIVGLLTLGGVMAVLMTAAGLIWIGHEPGDPDVFPIAAVVLAILGIAGVVIVFCLIRLAINDFLVPLMYLRNCRVTEAWRELRTLISSRPGVFLLYVLVRFLIAVVAVTVTMLLCCLTCCLVLLPYVGTVILLPLRVFQRAYPLYFLGQFGPRYARFVTLGPEVDGTGGSAQPPPAATDS